MKLGKIAAQCAHAAVDLYKKASVKTPDLVKQWETFGQAKVTLKAPEGIYSDGLEVVPRISWNQFHEKIISVKLISRKKLKFNPSLLWKKGGEDALVVLQKQAREIGLCAVIIHDAGRTQIASGTATVLGIGPGPSSVIDNVSGHLKLYWNV